MTGIPLAGFTVGVTADRRRSEQAELFERQGATVLLGPAIATVPLGFDQALRAATLAMTADPPQFVVATTALGLEAWIATASLWGVDDELKAALAGARIAARGPKVLGALARVSLEAWCAGQEGTTAELVDLLVAEGLSGACVVVLCHGADMAETAALRAAGARVIEVPLYRWTLPADLRPTERLIELAAARRLDAVTFTAAPAVHNLFAVAEAAGRREALAAAFAGGVVATCIGPVCAAAARAEGVTAPLTPERSSLAAMVAAVTTELGTRRRHLRLGDIDVVLQGTSVRLGGDTVRLSERERAVLELLCQRAGAVVPRSRLLWEVWATRQPNAHAVDVTVARLRRRLGPAGAAIRTVPRRGYLLEVSATA